MDDDSRNDSQHQEQSPAREFRGKHFYHVPAGTCVHDIVEARRRYPQRHEASPRHPENRQQVVAHQQEEQVFPQHHQYMGSPIMQQEYPAPPMLQQQHMAPRTHEQHPPVFQQQQYMVPMMSPPNVVSGQGQWIPSTPPQPNMIPPPNFVSGSGQWIPNATPQPTMMSPPNVVTGQGQWISSASPQPTMLVPMIVPVIHNFYQPPIQQGPDQYIGGYPINVAIPPQQQGSALTSQFASMSMTNQSNQEQVQSAQNFPVTMVDSGVVPIVVPVTETIEDPKVQSEKEKPIQQETMQAKQIEVQKTPEESVQQPIQKEPEALVQQPTQQKLVTEELNTAKADVSGHTYAEMAAQPKAQKQAPTQSMQKATHQPPKPKQAQERASKALLQMERSRQPQMKLTHESPLPKWSRPDDTWTTVGHSSSGPSSRQEQPVIVLKAPPPKQRTGTAVKKEEAALVETQDQDPPAEISKETRSSATKKKKNKNPGKPTQSKAEREAQEKEDAKVLDEAIASVQEEKSLQTACSKYLLNHYAIRKGITANGFEVDCSNAVDFEHSLIKHFAENKDMDWGSKTEEVKKFLKETKDGKKKSKNPKDKDLVQKYSFLLKNVTSVFLEDIVAIRALHPANPAQTLENEYFGLIFNPERPILFLNSLIMAAPKNDSLESYDRTITRYVNHQNRIRAKFNPGETPMYSITECWINMSYVFKKDEFNALLAQNRRSLIETYYRYWNWQRMQMKKNLPKNMDRFVRMNCVYSMASRDVHDPLNDCLLFDVHILSKEQTNVYKEVNLNWILENSLPYLSSIFFPESKRVN